MQTPRRYVRHHQTSRHDALIPFPRDSCLLIDVESTKGTLLIWVESLHAATSVASNSMRVARVAPISVLFNISFSPKERVNKI